MFLLKTKTHSDYVDCDEFGWWLTGCNPEAQNCDEEVATSDGISLTSCYTDEENSFFIVQETADEVLISKKEDLGEDDGEEIYPGEEPPCKTSSRSYTPERLVRTQDYSILTRSPTPSTSPDTESSTASRTPCRRYLNRRNRCLNHLIDKQLVGASQLEALLDPDPLDIRIPVASARSNTFNGRFLPKETSPSGDILDIVDSDSPQRLLTPDLMSSGSSCERVNSDSCQYDSLTINRGDYFGKEKFKELKNAFGSHRNSGEEVLLRDEISRKNFWGSEFSSETREDPDNIVRNLRGRIEHIKDTNKDIFGDLYSLRNKFQWAEKKTGNLTAETTRLRGEIRELRYLDDLVNLLRGELERISQRNWPFNLGHTDHQSEEINLVV